MWVENTIYEAGQYGTLKDYSKLFIDAFMTKPKDWPVPYEEFPIKNGQTDQEFSGVDSRIKKYNLKFARTPLLVAFEIEPGFWSLNLASDPNIVVCQIDHNDKVYRLGETISDEVMTALTYATRIFKYSYAGYDKKTNRPARGKGLGYTTSAEIVTKDFTNSKYLTRLDLTSFFRAI